MNTNTFRSLLLIFWLLAPVFCLAQCIKGNCKNGQGTYQFKSGAKFVGTFKNGKMYYGTHYYTNKDSYVGNYINNKRHGEGAYYYSSGNVFKGKYENGQKTYGTFQYVDGSVYVGAFQKGKRHGKGKMTHANGRVHNGYWKNDVFVGAVENDPVTTYALIVAIADYQYMGYRTGDLAFTVNDAKKFYDFVQSGQMGEHERVVEILLDQKATKSNILRTMQRLFSQADENDKVMLYFSGHGDRDVFLPYDLKPGDARTMLYHREIKSIFKQSKSKNKLLIADACYSGSLKKEKPKVMDRASERALDRDRQEDVSVAIMISCMENEKSYEHPSLKQGVFSYFLMKGLKGEADANVDQTVTIEELYYYVRNGTYNFVKNNLKKAQRPVLFGNFDRSMSISILNRSRS